MFIKFFKEYLYVIWLAIALPGAGIGMEVAEFWIILLPTILLVTLKCYKRAQKVVTIQGIQAGQCAPGTCPSRNGPNESGESENVETA